MKNLPVPKETTHGQTHEQVKTSYPEQGNMKHSSTDKDLCKIVIKSKAVSYQQVIYQNIKKYSLFPKTNPIDLVSMK